MHPNRRVPTAQTFSFSFLPYPNVAQTTAAAPRSILTPRHMSLRLLHVSVEVLELCEELSDISLGGTEGLAGLRTELLDLSSHVNAIYEKVEGHPQPDLDHMLDSPTEQELQACRWGWGDWADHQRAQTKSDDESSADAKATAAKFSEQQVKALQEELATCKEENARLKEEGRQIKHVAGRKLRAMQARVEAAEKEGNKLWRRAKAAEQQRDALKAQARTALQEAAQARASAADAFEVLATFEKHESQRQRQRQRQRLDAPPQPAAAAPQPPQPLSPPSRLLPPRPSRRGLCTPPPPPPPPPPPAPPRTPPQPTCHAALPPCSAAMWRPPSPFCRKSNRLPTPTQSRLQLTPDALHTQTQGGGVVAAVLRPGLFAHGARPAAQDAQGRAQGACLPRVRLCEACSRFLFESTRALRFNHKPYSPTFPPSKNKIKNTASPRPSTASRRGCIWCGDCPSKTARTPSGRCWRGMWRRRSSASSSGRFKGWV